MTAMGDSGVDDFNGCFLRRRRSTNWARRQSSAYSVEKL